MSLDYISINNNQEKRKKGKRFLIFILSALFVGLSFGTGILIAEIKIRNIKTAHDSNLSDSFSQNLPADNSGSASSENKQAEENELAINRKEAEQDNNSTEQSAVSQNEDIVKFSFAVIGDTQRLDSNNPAGGIQKAVNNIKKQNVDLVFALGDLNSSCDGGNGCESKLTDWKNILGSLFFKTYVTMGNHDRTGKEKADSLWQKFFNLPVNGPSGFSELAYSFDFNNSHFVVLDSEKPEEHIVSKTQRNWLSQDLAANKKENTFIFFHEPAYPVSSKIDESLDVKSGDRNALWNIFAQYKVTAVFSGHEHIHSRRKIAGVYQFVFGNTDSFDHDMPKAGVAEYAYRGKNFGIVNVEGKNITIKVYSVDGNLLNSFAFNK